MWLQNVQVYAYTIIGMATPYPDNYPAIPNNVVSIDPNNCNVSLLAPFSPGTVYGGSGNIGAVDSQGYYFCNFQTTTNWWGPSTTFSIDLNNPNNGWSSWGSLSIFATAVNSDGDVFGAAINLTQGMVIAKIDAQSKTETPFGDFPAQSAPAIGDGATIDGDGNFWSNTFIGPLSDMYDYFTGMDTSSGHLNYKVQVPGSPSSFPYPSSISWDSQTNTFYAVCQVGEYFFSMCRIYPESTNDVVPYGTQVNAAFSYSSAFSISDRILYIQFNIDQLHLNTNLVGFDIDTGDIIYNCYVPDGTTSLLNLAIW